MNGSHLTPAQPNPAPAPVLRTDAVSIEDAR